MRMAMEWKGIVVDEEECCGGALAGVIVFAIGTIAVVPSMLSHTRYVKSTTARRLAAMTRRAVLPRSGHKVHSMLSRSVVA